MLNRRSTSAAGALAVWLVMGCGSGEHSEFFSPMGTSSGSDATGTGGGSTAASGSGSTGDATSGSTASGASTTGSGDTTGSAGGSSTSGSGGATSGQGGAPSGSATGSGGSNSGAGGAGGSGGALGSGGAGMNVGGSGPGGSTGASGAGGAGPGGSAGSTGTAGRAGGGGAGGTTGAGGFGGGFGGKGGAGGGSGGIGTFCSSNNSCQPNLYCKKSTCALDPLGRCAARPAACGSDEAPSCGCDGITYFNPCLAGQNGQNIGSNGACGITAVKCVTGEKTCEVRKNGYCGVILEDSDECSIAKPPGQCWVLPEQCLEFDAHFNACGSGNDCIHTCDALKSEEPVYPVSNCH